MTGFDTSHPGSVRADAWVIGAALLAWAAFLFRYGYGFGFSDQDEFLPLALRFMDSALFQADAFVQMQAESWSIRWPIAGTTALLSALMPTWLVVFALHMTTGLLSAGAIARIVRRVSVSPVAVIAGTVAAVAVTARWNPGGNDIVHGMLVPSSLAWCAILWAVERFLANRHVASGLLLALATVVHPLVGLQAGAIMVAASAWNRELRWASVWEMAGPWLVVVVPSILLLVDLGSSMNALQAADGSFSGTAASEATDATTVLTRIRAPHHYLPTSFAPSDFFALGALALGAGFFLWRGGWTGKKALDTPSSHLSHGTRSKLGSILGLTAGVLVLSLTVTAWPIQWDLALRLQPWAVSPLLRVLAAAILVASVTDWMWHSLFGRRKTRTSSRSERTRPFPASFLVLLAGGAAVLLALSDLGPDIRGAAHPDRELHDWISEETDPDAVFVIPPSMSGFQFGARRAQYVSFKSFPFAPEPTLEWWRRLQQVAPVESAFPGGTALLHRLDSAYVSMDVAQARQIAAPEPVDYWIRPANPTAGWSDMVEPQWCSDEWCVFWAGRILLATTQEETP